MTWHNIWGYWLLTTSNKASAKTFNFQIFCVESFLIISISPFWWREWLFWDLLGTNFCDLPETPCAIFNPFVPFVDPCNNRLLAGLPDLYLQAVSVGQWVVSDQFQTTDQFSTSHDWPRERPHHRLHESARLSTVGRTNLQNTTRNYEIYRIYPNYAEWGEGKRSLAWDHRTVVLDMDVVFIVGLGRDVG